MPSYKRIGSNSIGEKKMLEKMRGGMHKYIKNETSKELVTMNDDKDELCPLLHEAGSGKLHTCRNIDKLFRN